MTGLPCCGKTSRVFRGHAHVSGFALIKDFVSITRLTPHQARMEKRGYKQLLVCQTD